MINKKDIIFLLMVSVAVIAGVTGVSIIYKQRGLRNNNAGNLVLTNIKWKGKIPNEQNTDGKFEQFTKPEWGLRAMFHDLRGDIEKDGLNTIRKLIYSYAPPNENLTEKYIESVVKQTGLSADAKITQGFYLPLMKEIMKHENGLNPYDDNFIIYSMGLV